MQRTKSIEIATALLLWVLFLYLPVPATAYLVQPSQHAGIWFHTSELQQDEDKTGFILFETEQKKATGSSESNSLDLFCDAGNQTILLSAFEDKQPLKPFPGFRSRDFLFLIFPNAP